MSQQVASSGCRQTESTLESETGFETGAETGEWRPLDVRRLSLA